MTPKKIALVVLAVIVGSGAAYAISPYFTESEINEPLPPLATTADNPYLGSIETDYDDNDDDDDFDKNNPVKQNDDKNDLPSMGDNTDDVIIIDHGNDNSDDFATTTTETTPSSIPPISYAGVFVGVGDGIHDAGGHTYTIPLEDGSSVLRLEDFYSTNGPGLRVYLATDTKATDYVSLGDLKANRGNQNYEIPHDTNLEKYNHVLIWCEPFSVLFGSAELGVR